MSLRFTVEQPCGWEEGETVWIRTAQRVVPATIKHISGGLIDPRHVMAFDVTADMGDGIETIKDLLAQYVFKTRIEALKALEAKLIERSNVGPISRKRAEAILKDVRAQIESN